MLVYVMTKKYTVLCAALLCAFAFGVSAHAADVVDKVVAVVGDEVILLSELQKQIQSQMMARNMDVQNTPRDQLMKLQSEVLEGMVDDRLLFVKAIEDSIEIDAREVDRELNNQINAVKMKYGSDEAFTEGLEEYGLTEVQLRKMYGDAIAKDFLLQRIRYDITRMVSVTAYNFSLLDPK